MDHIGSYAIQQEINFGKSKAYIAQIPGKTVFIKTPQRWEIDALRKSSHPNIVRLEEILGDTNNTHIALEYIPGKDLFEKRQTEGPFEALKFYSIALQVAKALKSQHEAGFVYNDMKPENVMVTPIGAAKVVDLGSCVPTSIEQHSMATSQGYRCIEQIRRENMPENDIFGLGAVMYFMTHGIDPVNARGRALPHQEEMNRLRKKIPRNCHPDKDTSHLVRSMLSPKARDRPSMDQVEQFLAYKFDP